MSRFAGPICTHFLQTPTISAKLSIVVIYFSPMNSARELISQAYNSTPIGTASSLIICEAEKTCILNRYRQLNERQKCIEADGWESSITRPTTTKGTLQNDASGKTITCCEGRAASWREKKTTLQAHKQSTSNKQTIRLARASRVQRNKREVMRTLFLAHTLQQNASKHRQLQISSSFLMHFPYSACSKREVVREDHVQPYITMF